MPGWIWLLLVIFMIVVLIAGAAYVVFRALAAMRTATKLSTVIGAKIADAQSSSQDKEPQDPLLTQPLSVASDRYSQTHAEVLRRHNRIHERHMRTWQQWRYFND
ncbi:MAG: hypothetical protein ABF780_03030 [Bifidobacterium aquikefiri]|uniref:Uncharacterized protein n=1 Tax=Bifidobacterium aquikefiri TaxID=1653207 RepID=A0A261G5W8_9BIFI|nr:hypothetical protein [Bifidobacterium aquikefiri]OZG66819.1 hypothetical protein BAQU_0891 [Bifidobacterium aquikefiri]